MREHANLAGRIGTLCGVALATVVAAAPAAAVPVDVTYNIQIVTGIPSFGVPTAFSGSGWQTLRFANGTPGGHVSAGPISIQNGFASLSGSFFVGTNFISGAFNFINQMTGGGSVFPTGLFTLFTGAHVTMGFLHCSGPNCASFGLSPSVPQPLTSSLRPFSQTGFISNGFPSLGPQSFTALGTAGTFGGATLTVMITGQEVSRAVVPEPGSGLLLGLGLTGLGAFAARWRRRRT